MILPTFCIQRFFILAPSPPRNVKAAAVRYTTADITFDPPVQINGELLQYTGEVCNKQDCVNSSTRETRMFFSELAMDTKYQVRVFAETKQNAEGNGGALGELSEVISFTTWPGSKSSSSFHKAG